MCRSSRGNFCKSTPIPMNRVASVLGVLALSAASSGCVARTAAHIVTAPVRVTSKVVDMATTSQSEADEKRGRAMRKHEERVRKLNRSYENNSRDCERGNSRACEKARKNYAEIRELNASAY